MIKSTFSIITSITYDSAGQFQSCFADQGLSFTLTFSGSNLYRVEGIELKKLYAKVLLCWGDGVSSLFVILKNNKIYNIDNMGDNKRAMIEYMVKHSDDGLLSDFESMDDIYVFSKL